MGIFSSGDFASVRAFSSNWDSNVSLVAVVTAASFLVLSTSLFKRHSKDPRIHYLTGFNIVHAWRFFTKRYDFLSGNFKKTGKKFFEFYVLQVRVTSSRCMHVVFCVVDEVLTPYIEPGPGVAWGGAAEGILYPPESLHDARASVSCWRCSGP